MAQRCLPLEYTRERTGKICHLQSRLNGRLRVPGILAAAAASPRLVQGPTNGALAGGMEEEDCSALGLPSVNAANLASGAFQQIPRALKGPPPGASGNKASGG